MARQPAAQGYKSTLSQRSDHWWCVSALSVSYPNPFSPRRLTKQSFMSLGPGSVLGYFNEVFRLILFTTVSLVQVPIIKIHTFLE